MEAPKSDVTCERADWLNIRQHELLSRVEISAAYHGKRERFLTLCERMCQAIAALTATAAFSQIFDKELPAAGKWFALAAAVASILPLVFGWSSRANHHAVLAADHRRLLARIVGAGYVLPEQTLVELSAAFMEIEAGEGASLGALVVHCQNEKAIAAGHAASVVPLTIIQRLTMHVWDWSVKLPEK